MDDQGTSRLRHRRLGSATSSRPSHDYIRIPNVSPVFEEDWAELGHMRAGGRPARRLGRARPIPGLTLEIHEIEGLTPVIFMEIPPANGGSADDTVLLYGHLDKQPELFGWREGLGPWEPVIEGDRLYGRGGADDGYSTFASLTCDRGGAGGRASRTRGCVVLIEASEESGSRDLPAHIEALVRSDRHAEPRRSVSTPAAPTTTTCGSRPRCAGCSPASSTSACCRRACTPATPAESCRRRSASPARSCRGSRTRTPARSCSTDFNVEIPAGPRSPSSRARPRCSRRRSPR